jgi:hypothetical protein
MTNFERLRDAGLFHGHIQQQTDLDQAVSATIDTLTSEEVDALISAYNKLPHDDPTQQATQSRDQVRQCMSITGF